VRHPGPLHGRAFSRLHDGLVRGSALHALELRVEGIGAVGAREKPARIRPWDRSRHLRAVRLRRVPSVNWQSQPHRRTGTSPGDPPKGLRGLAVKIVNQAIDGRAQTPLCVTRRATIPCGRRWTRPRETRPRAAEERPTTEHWTIVETHGGWTRREADPRGRAARGRRKGHAGRKCPALNSKDVMRARCVSIRRNRGPTGAGSSQRQLSGNR